jgi:Type IV secretion system pilin
MFSTIKSIIKTLSILSLFATLVLAGLSNLNASAQAGTTAEIEARNRAAAQANGSVGGASGLTPALCGAGQVGGAGGVGACPLLGNATASLASRDSVSSFIINIARFFIYIASAIAVIFIVYGGYLYIADGGDDKRAGTGKKILINALIGLAICILAITIVTFISGTLEGNVVGQIVGNQVTR